MNKRWLFLGFGSLAFVSSARAQAATPPVVTQSALPTATFASPPPSNKRPFSVGAHERVPGFHAGLVGKDQTIVAGTRDQIDRFTGRSRSALLDEDKSREFCFSEAVDTGRNDADAAPAWEPSLQPMVGLRGDRVNAVHLERVLDEQDDRATLETTDAWVDPKTRGVRLIARAKLPLKLVAKAPGDIRIYAMRDKQQLHVFLVEPTTTTRSWQGIVQANAQGMSASGCRHSRSTLSVERGNADTSTFMVTAELPPTEADKQLLAEPGSFVADSMEAVRIRQMHVHASVSWASKESEPVLSVSMGWDARDKPATVAKRQKPRAEAAKVAKK